MAKRGQVTTFIIVGIVLLIVIILALFARDFGVGVAPKKYLESNLEPVEDEVGRCADDIALKGLNLIGSQGGDMNPSNYKLNDGNKIKYLCLNIQNDKRCMNILDPLSNIEKQLNDFMNFEMNKCVDLNKFKGFFERYDIKSGNPKIEARILDDNVLINVDYPITLTKEGQKITLPKVVRKVDVPLGSLYGDVYNIVQSHASLGEFDSLPYMLGRRGEVEIETLKPYPDTIYILNKRNSNYIFQFAIQGEEESIE